jgi:UDP-N-acetylmuramoyl-L-alanine---L-glutamate ligase
MASLRKLRSMGVEPVIVSDVPKASYGEEILATADAGLAALKTCEVVIKTPGISRYRPEIAQLVEHGVPVAGGLGLWLQEADLARVVCVTGTKGKSTTSSVLGHLLTRLGKRCLVGGNIGIPPYDPGLPHPADHDYWVIEVSSYQATDLASSPPVMALTSLHPDHLPWHGGVDQYYCDKLSAFSQPGGALTIANADSDLIRSRAGMLADHVMWVSADDAPDARWTDELGLPGMHNRRNALLAWRCLLALGVAGGEDDTTMRAAARGYQPLPSRLRTVGAAGGVSFVDDSLSTNVLSTLAALDSFPNRRIALIVGGHDRGIDYAPLAAGVVVRQAPTAVFTIPDNGGRIGAEFRSSRSSAPGSACLSGVSGNGGLTGVTDCPDLATAVLDGLSWARPDGIVLLSPAAPSFGQFVDYRDRSDAFGRAVQACTS